MAPLGMCEGWIDVDDLQLCTADSFPDGRLQRALDAATGLLHKALGLRWPGTCTDRIRPCGGCAVQWLAYPAGGARPLPGSGCPTGGGTMFCGQSHDAIRLPNGPVLTNPSSGLLDGGDVLVNGEAVFDYVIVDDVWLLRRGGWPCFQDLTLESDEPGTFEVSYRWGTLPPAEVLMATEVLACELAKSWSADEACRLPRRLTSLVREGVAMTVLDSFDFLRDGGFGLYEVDVVVRHLNPEQLDRPAKWIDTQAAAAGLDPHRVR